VEVNVDRSDGRDRFSICIRSRLKTPRTQSLDCALFNPQAARTFNNRDLAGAALQGDNGL
jgi:hypothetical protein